MFIEPNINNERRGCLEVICGSMFSGKTEELIRRLNMALIANQKVAIFKPALDTRYQENQIVSHDEKAIPSLVISHPEEILSRSPQVDLIGIDEAQFFDNQLSIVCEQLAFQGIRVIVAGLDMDYLGRPFGPIPDLLAKADYITKLHAICVQCGQIANYSYRKVNHEARFLIGDKDIYEPRCRNCYTKGEILA